MFSVTSNRSLVAKSPWTAALDRLTGELKDKDDQVRVRAARDLSQYVATQSRELKSELFGEFMADLNKYISQLVSSSNSNDVIGGIIAINELIEVDFRSHTIALARLAESLKIGLNSADPTVLSLAAQALGRLSRLPITLTYEICVGELKRALDSLKETQESRRHGAVLVLRAMASEAPTLFYGQMSNFVDVVWYAMRDSRQVVRMLAAETLGIALRLIGERDNAFQWNRYVYDLTTNGFRPASEPDVHGSLLALGELLTNAKDFMSGRTNEVCNLLQRYTQEKEKASQTIKQTVISLLPKAAASNPDAFVESSLQMFMDYLLGIITSPQPTKQSGSSSSSSSTTSSSTASGTQLIIGPGGLFGSSGPTGFSSFGAFPSFYGSSTSYLLSHYGYANSLAYGSGAVGASGMGVPSVGGSLFVSSPIPSSHSSGSSSHQGSNSGVGPVSSLQNTLPIQFFFPSDNAERSLALFATGELALALGPRADKFKKEDIDKVIREIQDTLSRHQAPNLAPKMRSSASSVNDALACLTMLAQAVGPKIHQGTGMKALLDKIFSVKLSPQLIAALTALVDHIPSLVKDIQLRLVDKLSGVLRQKFTPNMKAASTTSSTSSSSSSATVASASVTSELSASTTFGGTLSAKDGKKLKTVNSVKAIQPPLSGGGAVGFLSATDSPKPELGDTSNIGVVTSAIVPAGTPVNVPGSPAASVSGSSSAASKDTSAGTYPVVDEERTPELIALALNTLGSFNVIGYIQNIDEFLRDIAVNFLEEDNTTIRREAAVAVPQLLVRLCSNPKFVSTPISSFPLSEVIERLLLVGISDVDPAIRHTVLIHLEPTLDAFLAAPENLRCLFIALNDEVFAIRETAIAIIGRLSLRNPSDVMPSLRRTLIQLLTELEFGGDPRLKAESAQLLSVLIRNSRNLIEPYVKPILKALLPKLDPSQDPKVRQEILSAVGELAPAGQDMVASHMDTLIPLIVSYLADQTTIGRRELALRVLAQLTRYTSHVVDPLSRWPDLLHLLLAIAKTEKSKFVRRQVLRVLGTMGALDPYTFKMSAQPSSSQGALSVGVLESEEDDDDKMHRQLLKQLAAARAARGAPNGNAAGAANGGGGVGNAAAAAAIAANFGDPTLNAARLLNPSTASTSRRAAFSDPNSDTYYPYVAIKSLSTILWDQSLGAYHEKVVRSVVMITKECVGESKVQLFLPVIMPPFLHLLGGAEKEFSVLLLNQISLLVTIAKGMPSVREYLIHVFHMVSDLWQSELLPSILGFIEEISSVMGDEFMVFLPFLIPKLLSVLDSPDSVEMCMRILRTLEWVGPSLDDYLHLVAPAIMTLVNQADSELLRIAAMQTIGRMCRVLNFSEYASRIIQPMARLLQTQVLSNEFKNAILCTLCHLVHQLGSDYAIFVPVMNRILNKRQITHATYEFLVSKVLKNQAILESELPALGEIQIPSGNAAISGATGGASGASASAHSTSSKSSAHHKKEKEKEKKSKTDKRDTKSSDIRTTTQAGDAGAPNAATGAGGAAGGVPGPAGTMNQGNMTSRGEPTGAGVGASILQDAGSGHRGTISLASGVSLPLELKVNEANLRKAWAASSQSTRDDWDEWMRRFSVELVRESPQHSLRFCLELAKEYFPLVRDVFTAAFVSCWTALSRQARTEFTDNLRTALKSPHMPREILQQWLNVAEFMEQSRIDPIEIHKELGRLAFKCHAYAKALHYKELEFQKQQTPEAVEALITINTQLQQPEAAEGMLRYSQERMNLDLRESWYEKLHRWEDALLVHRSKRPKPTVFFSAPMATGPAPPLGLSNLASSASIAVSPPGAGSALTGGNTGGASAVGTGGMNASLASGASGTSPAGAGASSAGASLPSQAGAPGPLGMSTTIVSLPGIPGGATSAAQAAAASAMTTAVFWPAPTIPIYDHDSSNLMPGKTGSLSGAAAAAAAAAAGMSGLSLALGGTPTISSATASSATGRAGSVDASVNEKEAAPNSTSSSSSSMGTSATSTSIGASESTIQNAIAASQKQQEVYNQSIVGEMRCLHSLGEWDRLLELSVENWKPEYKNRTSIASYAASAAWHLHDWNAMATFLEELRDTNVECLMMKTVLQLQKAATPAEFEHVRFLIDKTRDAVDTEMTPLLAESYQRAYDALINVQLLAEMEDVIDFKLYPERRSVIRKVWRERLERCQRSVATWQRILAVRAIAEMEESTWLRFATLCRKTGALRQSHKVLTILMGTDPAKQPMAPLPTQRPSVTYQYILQLWTAGAREIAYQHLVKFESFLEMHRPTPLERELGSSLAALGLTGWIVESSSSTDASAVVSAAGGNAGVTGVASASGAGPNTVGGVVSVNGVNVKSTQAGNNAAAVGGSGGVGGNGVGANGVAVGGAGGNVAGQHASGSSKAFQMSAAKRSRVRRPGDGSTHLTVRLNAASPFALLTAKLDQQGGIPAGGRNKLANTRRTSHALGGSGASSGTAEPLQSESASPSELAAIGEPNDRASKMQARCALTLGLWQLDMHEHSLDSEKIDLIISNLGKALVCDPTWPKAWHVWATTNFEMATIYEKRLARHAARRKNMPAPLLASATSLHLRTAASYAVTGGSSTSIVPGGSNAAAAAAAAAPQGSNAERAANTANAAANARNMGAKHGSLTSITNPGTHDPNNAAAPAPHLASLRRGASTGQGGSAAAILSGGGSVANAGSSADVAAAAAAAAAAATAQVAHVQQHNSMTLDKERLFRHVDAAVKGFFRSIALSHGAQTLQDTLRLLTLWFKYGGDRLIEPVLQEGFNSVPIDTWLPVIPQIIARMDSSNLNVRRMVAELLSRIGKEHPQALVYPLVLTAKATNTTRQSMAHTMMNQMRQYDQLHYNTNANYSSLSGGAFSAAGGALGGRMAGGGRRTFVHADDDDDDNMGWAFSPNGGHDQILGFGAANIRGKNTQSAARGARPAHHPYSTFATGEEGMFTHHQSHGAGAAQANGGMAMNAIGEFGLGGAAAGGWNSSLSGSSSISFASGQANFLSLIDQALLISEELIRVAISDTEAWHECLEEASRAYFFDNNPQQMVSIVRPLHEALLQPTQHAMSSLNENGVVGGRHHTSMELSFRQAYSAPLNQAWGWCLKYVETGSTMCLNQAWDLYWYVYHAINKQQEKLTSLQLSAVSPRLLGLTQLSLAVPGTYQVGAAPVTITGFHPVVTIIPSKQRPRKLRMTGSDGVHYSFLLKGHEDLRQDERVMQLFGLINNLLLANPQTANKHLRIQRFSVTPLSPNSGLIGWVPHCDTMNALIKEYRTTAEPKIPVDSETQILERQYPEYPQLMVVQKIEVFKLMTAKFDGKDLANIMWLKSPSSEVWLDRRTNYIRSLAVMSMAGYILGLGDRHPSNIMIDRFSGHVVHIDFGDCFETAMLREKHPEKVPFRLTRMVINAMEVSGIEGTFRTTCNQVLEVMRKNRDSLMAVLEAFVHDPLINWGLKTNANANAANANKDGAANGANKGGDNAAEGGAKGTATSPPNGDGVSNFSGSYSLRDTISSSGAFSAASHRFRDYNFQDDEAGDYAYRQGGNGTTPSQNQQNNNANNAGGANANGGPQRDKEATGEKELNERALSVISRVHNKLTGRDFGDRRNQGRNPLTVPEQVHKLIQQATSTENLCQSFSGWCPWW